MKILFSPCHYVYDEIVSGSEQSWAFNIADKIASEYEDSVVITGFKRIGKEKPYMIIELQKGKSRIDLSLRNALKFNWQYFLATNKELRKQRFDLIHHVLPFAIDHTFNLSLLLNRTKNLPFVVGPMQSSLNYKDTDLDVSNLESYNPRKLKLDISQYFFVPFVPLLRYLSTSTLKKASKIIVINQHTKRILTNKGLEEEKIEVIPPGIDSEKFKYIPFQVKDPKELQIITVGYLIKRKGIDLLIKAIREVVEKNPTVRLTIIGDGPQKKSLMKLIHDLNLEDFIFFKGYVPHREIQKYYQDAHIFVSMSRAETWGQMYLEAMACGLPIITTKNVGANEIIKEGQIGYLIGQEDYHSTAKIIQDLAENKNLIAEFGRNARRETETNYDWNKVIIPKYLKLYEDLIAQSHRR